MENTADFGDGVGHNSDGLTLDRQIEGAKDHIESIESAQAHIDQIMEKAKAEAASHRDTIASEKKKCRDDFNIEAKALVTILTKRKQDRRMAERIEALEDTARAQFDMFEEKFN